MADDKFNKANNFITKLKAYGTESDTCNLKEVSEAYKIILSELAAKDRGSFSLNVLCILCRNIEKVALWREKICNVELLELSISCLRQTRTLDKSEQVKSLACVYHIHRYVVRQDTVAPPALLLKLSCMPFEVTQEYLLKDHCKVYWSVLADRFLYIEKLKSTRRSIADLLPKLNEDIKTIIALYNPVQFCTNVLIYVIKKLHFLYSDIRTEQLMVVYRDIFDNICTKDNIKLFKCISMNESMDLYVKLNECLYVMIENESKVRFKGSDLDYVVRKMVSLLGHCSEIFHCFQTVYLNCFCSVFKYKANSEYVETVLESLQNSCVTAEKLGYEKVINSTYPFIAQLLRLYIEHFINNVDVRNWMDYFNMTIQGICLKIILFLIEKLNGIQQLTKCENCGVKTGLHDALRLTFLTKYMMTVSVEQNMDISLIFHDYYNIVEKQYKILNNLKRLKCLNQEKCLKKLQTDVHNTAIVLNKAKFYKYSIKLFHIYLNTELTYVKNETEFKNISRAFYNKSISELDCMLFEDAINGAYLSLVFSGQDYQVQEKYMSLVMDIKAKALKRTEDDQDMQLKTVLTACKDLSESKDYVNLKPFFSTLKFSALLKHEFSMYVKLWPSIVPIAGVWMSLNDLTKGAHTWLEAENKETLLQVLYEVMLATPNAVRTIHSEHLKGIVAEILQRIRERPKKNLEEKIVEATLLFLQSEYDIAEASEKYGWKQNEPTLSLEQIKDLRTLPQEQRALRSAVQAVDTWTEILSSDTALPTSLLHHSLQIAQVLVQQLIYTQRLLQGLQLAHICCELARLIADKKAYLTNAGVILFHVTKASREVECLVTTALSLWEQLVPRREHLDTVLVFACELAMYYLRCGREGTGARLLRFVQARLLQALELHDDANLELAVGRLLEAEALVSGSGPDALSRASAVQRHYVAVTNSESKWVSRRHRSLALRAGGCAGAALAARGARALLLWRRARSALAAALRGAGALSAAHMYALYVDTNADDAEVNIDRIKHILGLQPTNEIQPYCDKIESKVEQRSPRHAQVETMLRSSTFRRVQTSPTSPMVTSAFTMPEFLVHDGLCQCYACQVPASFIIAYKTCLLEASMYFRSKEYQIARNYFDGASEALKLCKEKLKSVIKNTRKFEKYVCEIVYESWMEEIRTIEVDMLIEEAYLEISQNDFTNIDCKLVRLDELKEKINPYLVSDINNLLIATSRLKRVVKKKEEDALEIEMEHLKLSPSVKLVKTPESKKSIPPKETNRIVKESELPELNYKISKLNLEGEDYDEKEPIKEMKKTKFKIPVPIINKPTLETITPGPRSRLKVLVTQASDDQVTVTPSSKTEFFTPSSTPAEQFFTPMSTMKTYTRKRAGIVKKLDSEFSTPKVEVEKENKAGVRTRRGLSSRLNK